MITATLKKVPGGYLLNGRLFLRDKLDTPFGRAAVKQAASELADRIDAELAERVYREVCGQ